MPRLQKSSPSSVEPAGATSARRTRSTATITSDSRGGSNEQQLELFHQRRDDLHRSLEGRLARPRHAAPRTRGEHIHLSESIGADGATCGRPIATDRPGTPLGFDVPDTARPGLTEPQLVSPAPLIGRMLGGAASGDGTLQGQAETRTMARGIVQIPRVASRSVSAIASYAFVLALVACTFLV